MNGLALPASAEQRRLNRLANLADDLKIAQAWREQAADATDRNKATREVARLEDAIRLQGNGSQN
jgi:hypothetical protein